MRACGQGFVPDEFTASDYWAATRQFRTLDVQVLCYPGCACRDYTLRAHDGQGVQGGAVVSGSFQLYDQEYLHDALGQLGAICGHGASGNSPDRRFVGVTQLPLDRPIDGETVRQAD